MFITSHKLCDEYTHRQVLFKTTKTPNTNKTDLTFHEWKRKQKILKLFDSFERDECMPCVMDGIKQCVYTTYYTVYNNMC